MNPSPAGARPVPVETVTLVSRLLVAAPFDEPWVASSPPCAWLRGLAGVCPRVPWEAGDAGADFQDDLEAVDLARDWAR